MRFKNLSIVLLTTVSFVACGDKKKEDESKIRDSVDRVILVYAVNNNNLSGDLISNRKQLERIAPNFNSGRERVLLYNYNSSQQPPTLSEFYLDKGVARLRELKSWSLDTLSVSPTRIHNVLNYAVSLYPKATRTLFFWGHGLGPINPYKYGNVSMRSESTATEWRPTVDAYGGEYVDEYGRQSEYVDLDQLADAVPDGAFHSIWFDCCYMGNIEVAWEFHNKCQYMVAYPTEIMGEGLPYDRVVPSLIGNKIDLNQGAQALYDYYNSQSTPVTVGVYDMSKIESLGATFTAVLKERKGVPNVTNVQNYSRMGIPYYDLGQILNAYNSESFSDNPLLYAESKTKISEALNKFVIFSRTYSLDFNYRPISLNNFSGISCYLFKGGDTPREKYYRSLDFYRDVVAPSGLK